MKKNIILSILVFSLFNSYCQKNEKITKSKKVFVRIFNEKKIHSGTLVQTTDSSMFIIEKHKSVEVPLSQIKTIKLKRSFGHTILITTLIGGAVVAILGAASAEPDALILAYTAGEGALAGLILGSGSGIVVGSIIAGTKSRPVFNVTQNRVNWIKVIPLLDAYLPDK